MSWFRGEKFLKRFASSYRRFSISISRGSVPSINHTSASGKTKVLVIAGPTAVGKTGVSLDLASYVDCEIISADAVQAYKGLDIGSDKVSREARAMVPHHGLDMIDLSDDFRMSAASWSTSVYDSIADICRRGLMPVVVGGSRFYLVCLLEGINSAPQTTLEAEAEVERQMAERGNFAAK